MVAASWIQTVVCLVLLLSGKLLGGYMARLYQVHDTLLAPAVGPSERLLHRFAGALAGAEMTWRATLPPSPSPTSPGSWPPFSCGACRATCPRTRSTSRPCPSCP